MRALWRILFSCSSIQRCAPACDFFIYFLLFFSYPVFMFPRDQITARHNYAGATVHRSGSFTLELSSLRRNHARRRTALCRATPASLAASTGPVHSMKFYSHPRSLPVLRRVPRSLVLSGPGCSAGCSFCPRLPHCRVSPNHRTVEAAHPTQLGRCLIPPHPLRPIQST
jgi:hypothetical protein